MKFTQTTEALINHVSGRNTGVPGIYNRATYAVQKAAALSLWADDLKSLIGGGR